MPVSQPVDPDVKLAPPPVLERPRDPDLALLERWRAGDAAAGQALFERHFTSLYRFFQNKCDGDADELVQATLMACVTGKDTFRGDSTFRTYMFAIARHQLFRYLRERQRDAHLDGSVTSVGQVITTMRSVMARDQAHRALLEALRELPVEQQTLLELHYWEGLDTVELGRIFEVPTATIRTWLFRARGRLRELLAAHGPNGPTDAGLRRRMAEAADLKIS